MDFIMSKADKQSLEALQRETLELVTKAKHFISPRDPGFRSASSWAEEIQIGGLRSTIGQITFEMATNAGRVKKLAFDNEVKAGRITEKSWNAQVQKLEDWTKVSKAAIAACNKVLSEVRRWQADSANPLHASENKAPKPQKEADFNQQIQEFESIKRDLEKQLTAQLSQLAVMKLLSRSVPIVAQAEAEVKTQKKAEKMAATEKAAAKKAWDEKPWYKKLWYYLVTVPANFILNLLGIEAKMASSTSIGLATKTPPAAAVTYGEGVKLGKMLAGDKAKSANGPTVRN
jgi:hypothetical protein